MMILSQFDRHRCTTALIVVAIVAVVTAFGPQAARAAGEVGPTLFGREAIVLLFPVQVAADGAPPDAARWATNALQAAIDDLPNMICLDFSRTSPLVRRAVREGKVRSVDVERGVTEAGIAVEIGHAMGADMVVLATLQSYRVSAEPAQIEVVLAGQSYDVKSNYDEQTLEAKAELQVLRAFGVVGKSRPRAKFTGPEGVLAREALRDAAYRAAQVLAGRPAEAVGARPEKPKRHKAWRWFLIAAGIAGLVAIVNSGTEAHPARVTGADYRPRSFTAVAQPAGQNAIMLSWQPPRITDNLLGYELQRSFRAVGSQTPSPFTTVAGLAQLSAASTSWLDHGLNSKYVYMYRIRARYSDRQPGPDAWVYTGWVGFSGG